MGRVSQVSKQEKWGNNVGDAGLCGWGADWIAGAERFLPHPCISFPATPSSLEMSPLRPVGLVHRMGP